MNPDGFCYLDMGDAYLQDDWNMAVNDLWPPQIQEVIKLLPAGGQAPGPRAAILMSTG
jgi:hypothetical protein